MIYETYGNIRNLLELHQNRSHSVPLIRFRGHQTIIYKKNALSVPWHTVNMTQAAKQHPAPEFVEGYIR